MKLKLYYHKIYDVMKATFGVVWRRVYTIIFLCAEQRASLLYNTIYPLQCESLVNKRLEFRTALVEYFCTMFYPSSLGTFRNATNDKRKCLKNSSNTFEMDVADIFNRLPTLGRGKLVAKLSWSSNIFYNYKWQLDVLYHWNKNWKKFRV